MKNSSFKNIRTEYFSQILLILGMGIVLATTCHFGLKLYRLSAEQEQLKEDYSTANNITFGIFSLDLWKERLSTIVTQKIESFKITPKQKQEIAAEVATQLHSMINEVVNEFEKPQKGLGNKLKKFAFKQLVNPEELHAQVPSFTQTIVNRINSPRAIKKLKSIATSELKELAEQTYDSTSSAQAKMTRYLFKKYQVANINTFNNKIDNKLIEIRKTTYNYAYAMLGCAFFALCLWLPLRKKIQLHNALFVMCMLIALTLLVVGTTVSIIEVDARISELRLELLGEKIVFHNQVLFYQSKSIVGIAEVLMKQPKPDSITVGILILLFVIVLPVFRMLARGIHLLCQPLLSENSVTRYLAFESSKWDMSDVMVVGILMTYIGLNGILKSQLSGLNMKTDTLSTFTANYSSLQPGYIVFVGYVFTSIILSYVLKTMACEPSHKRNSKRSQ